MSNATLRGRLAKLEKRQRRFVGQEYTETELARRIAYSLHCAAHQVGGEKMRDAGRSIAVTFARNRMRTGEAFTPALTDLVMRALVGVTAGEQA